MINVEQLTSQLRMMPDQALQRVAMMYKQDPYILPMVISEGMARKKLRASAQMQGAQGQPPKVADQAIMAMAEQPPQPQGAPGIAGLPTPNMQNMADGGIAGYPDDTDYAERSEPVVRMAEGGVARYQAGGQARSIYDLDRDPLIQKLRGIVPDDELARMDRAALIDTIEKLVAAGKDVATYPGRAIAGVAEQVVTRPLRAAGLPIPYLPESFYGGDRSSATPYMDKLTAQRAPVGGARSAGIGGPRAGEREAYEAQMAQAVPTATAAPGAAPGAVSGAAPAAAPGAAAPARGPSEGGIYALAGKLFDPVEQQMRSRMGRMQMEAERRGDEERLQFEAGKPKGKIAEGLEAQLKKEEAEAPKEREQAKNMAIFNAGLAIMAGGSPNALQNIAKGAMMGSAQYSEALKDFKKAAKERQKMMSDIELARRAEERDDNKTALSLMQRANDRQEKIEGLIIEAGTSLGIKKADLTGRLYGTQMEQEGAMARVRTQDPLSLYRALGDGNIKKGFEAAQIAKREPITESSLRQDWAKSPVLQMQYPSVDEFIRMMMPKGQTAGASVDTTGFRVLGVRNP